MRSAQANSILNQNGIQCINGGSWTAYTSGASISAPEQAKIEVGVDTNASSSVDAGDVLASAKYIRLIIDATVK